MITFPTPVAETAADAAVAELVAHTKWAYTTRRIDLDRAAGLLTDPHTSPRAGDVVIARVTEIGQHKRLELQTGRRATLFVGDHVGIVYGARYAPDQFLAHLPSDLTTCNLVAAGGLAGQVELAHATMADATSIEPVGILTDAGGNRLNLRDSALRPVAPLSSHRPPTIAVVGSSMNAGKTTTMASLVRGLKAAGLTVGAAKVTGTGAGGDVWLLTDSGADHVYDFTHAGAPSTFGLDPAEVRGIFETLTTQLAGDGTDVNVIEVADGLFHAETAALLRDPSFHQIIDGVIFAARDSLSATAGVQWLRDAGLPLMSVSGLMTASPLSVAEFDGTFDVPVDDTLSLAEAGRAAELRDRALALRGAWVPGTLAAVPHAEEAV
ncbi:DUF1611 domain-containing protein [Ornithinimicrobium cavernae]|uniref:DUF1611 domain-containing protein n=1 Tax=Ornithinimicrobium cavernae TaxID=2666047 RepID=UPI00137B4505|nr:DUF1611 domain-containing protein [Ornithinimicrobium cavernae]